MLIENNETFLSELSKLFATGQANGQSLYLTMKRYEGKTKPEPRKHHEKGYKPVKRRRTSTSERDSTSESENKCLIRAHLSDKKISTIVSNRDMNKFQLAYSNLLKGNLYGIKKKDKKPRTTGQTSSGTSKATRD